MGEGLGGEMQMKRGMQQLKLPFAYCDTPELRMLDLSAEGLACAEVNFNMHSKETNKNEQ